MGLKGYGLWVNLIQPAEPHHGGRPPDAVNLHQATAFTTAAAAVVAVHESVQRAELDVVSGTGSI